MTISLSSPPLAMTMGDPSGIGPEIIAKTLATEGGNLVVFGSVVVMSDIVQRLGIDIEIRQIREPGDACFDTRSIKIIEATQITTSDPGQISGPGKRRQHHALPAVYPYQPGPWHGFRHCRSRHR